MKKLDALTPLIASLLASGFIAVASAAWQDSTATQPSVPDSSSQLLSPDSLRVTVDPGEFHWRRLRYEAEVRVAAFYSSTNAANQPDSLTIFVDVETVGATFWVESGEEVYEHRDYLVLHKGEIQAKGKVSWRLSSVAQVTVRADHLSKTVRTEVSFPMYLLLFCMLGGAMGGWLRRTRDPNSVVDLPVRLLPEKWSRRLVPLRESVVSMVAGILLYLLNLVSPVYLGFRPGFEGDWLMLVEPTLIGFIGGWGGISLLVHSLNLIFRSPETGEAAEASSEKKSRKR